MAALPYMRLYAADYLAATNHFSTEEHGAYLLLLLNYWQTGRPLNNTNERLAYVAHLSNERWLLAKDVLAEKFDIDGDTWTQQRVEYELEAVLSQSAQASYAGKQSARKRANDRLSVEDGAIPTPVERPLNARCDSVQRKSNHTDTDTDTEVKNKKNSSILDSEFIEFWKIYPRKDGKKAAHKAWVKARKKIDAPFIIAGVVNYKLACAGKEIEFVAFASTWLNGERWADESSTTGPKSFIPTPTPAQFVREPKEPKTPMPSFVRDALKLSIGTASPASNGEQRPNLPSEFSESLRGTSDL